MTTRIYQAMSLSSPAVIELDQKASHHVARVLRLQVNEPLIIFNGQGGEYRGTIVEINKKHVTVKLETYDARNAESPLKIYLAQGISRGEKMDYTIQKAVELGVTQIFPLFTERCNVKLDQERSEKRLHHWQSIVISACEQSGRNCVPEVAAPQTLDTWLAAKQGDHCFVLSPNAEHSLKKQTITAPASIVLLIGPEGGLSQREIAQAIEKGYLPLNLGPRILRTETAALAAITAIQCMAGDM